LSEFNVFHALFDVSVSGPGLVNASGVVGGAYGDPWPDENSDTVSGGPWADKNSDTVPGDGGFATWD